MGGAERLYCNTFSNKSPILTNSHQSFYPHSQSKKSHAYSNDFYNTVHSLHSRFSQTPQRGLQYIQCDHTVQITTAGPIAVDAVSTVNTCTMRICVTVASNSSEIDEIYRYCQLNGIVMSPGAYIYVGDSYWTWRIESEACSAITWLLLKYPDQLCVF